MKSRLTFLLIGIAAGTAVGLLVRRPKPVSAPEPSPPDRVPYEYGF